MMVTGYKLECPDPVTLVPAWQKAKPSAKMIFFRNFTTCKLRLIYCFVVITFTIGASLKRISSMRFLIIKAFNSLTREHISPKLYWKSLFGQRMFDNVWHSILLDTHKKVQLSYKACNAPVVSLKDTKYHQLLDFARGGRPLVVNFGSCTCPVFMKRLEGYKQLIARFKDVADFVLVYIEEAHPSDGWAFENNNSIPSHCTQTDRCSAAQLLSTHDAPCPVLVDTMLDAANIAYGAMPIRLYVIQDSHVVYQGGAGPMGYKMDDVSAWLIKNTRRKSDVAAASPRKTLGAFD